MSTTNEKHLKLRGNIYWYQRRIPKSLLDQFQGKTVICESLQTGDLREAKAKRDILNGKLQERHLNAHNPDRYRFNELIRTMSEDKENFPKSWDEHYDIDKSELTGDEVFLQAYTTVNGRKDHHKKHRITLKEGLANWIRKHANSKTKDTVKKVKSTTEHFLKYLALYDIQMEDISKRHAHDYIEFLQAKYAKTTAQGYISRLRSIWRYSVSIGEVPETCPFDGHSFLEAAGVEKKQPFTVDDIAQIKELVSEETPSKKLLVELGVYTGCRISELCNIKAKDIISEGDITAIFIEKGKTSAATRTIPLTSTLGARLRAIAENKPENELALGLEGKAMSRWFSNIKTKNISTDTTKCFHSFRVMFATSLQRSGVGELKAAALLGHERGRTMSFGYYSRGYELEQLKEAYDRCVERIIW